MLRTAQQILHSINITKPPGRQKRSGLPTKVHQLNLIGTIPKLMITRVWRQRWPITLYTSTIIMPHIKYYQCKFTVYCVFTYHMHDIVGLHACIPCNGHDVRTDTVCITYLLAIVYMGYLDVYNDAISINNCHNDCTLHNTHSNILKH